LLPETDARTPHEKKIQPDNVQWSGWGRKNDLMSGQPAVLSQLFFKEPRRTQQKHHKKPTKGKKNWFSSSATKKRKNNLGQDRKKKKRVKKQRSTSLKTANHLGGCSGTRQT
jgi:hypothetical protein